MTHRASYSGIAPVSLCNSVFLLAVFCVPLADSLLHTEFKVLDPARA